MKKILFIILFTICFTQTYEDVVILKNGWEIYGIIIEQKPNEYIKIQSGKNIFVFQMDEIDKARRYENKGFQWTRRIIALTAVFFIIGWPKLVPVFFDTSVYLTWTEFTRGFLFLIEQKEITMDKEFFGVVITPLDTHLMSAIIGLYFGGSLVKK